MYLKSLVLKGFKSFADRSVLSLEPGITAIVGPNGSGKSNISDAVLWVLGERSARNLRGQAMEDIIFSGSAARKAVSIAEVDLVLDNSDGTLPVEFDEVVITRRMYRSGESDYLVNGVIARRLDVLDILHDTGLGTGTHSIISQGSLDSILQSRPEDRRALIEEAAGVLKHKQRKEKSERKLQAMDNHLARVKDVAAEVQRQLGPLERKAKRAKAYEVASAQLSELQLSVAVDDLRSLQKAWDAVVASEKELEHEVEMRRAGVESAEQKVSDFQELMKRESQDAGELAKRQRRCANVSERLDSAAMLVRERRRAALGYEADALASIETYGRRKAEAARDLNEAQQQLKEAKGASEAADDNVKRLQDVRAKLSEQYKEADARMGELTAQIRKCDAEAGRTQKELAKLRDSLSNGLAHMKLVQARSIELQNDLSRVREEQEAASKAAADARGRLSKLEERVNDLQAALVAAFEKRDEARAAHDELKGRHTLLESEIRAVEQSLRTARADDPALAWLIDNASLFEGGLESVASALKVKSDYEKLVELLLAEDVEALAVGGPDQVCAVGKALEDGDFAGNVSVVMKTADNTGKVAAARGNASGHALVDVLEYPDSMASVVEALLGDVVLCESREDAMAAQGRDSVGLRFLSADGCAVWPSGKIRLYGKGDAKDEGVLAKERKLGEARAGLKQCAAELEAARESVERAEQAYRDAQSASLKASEELANQKGVCAAAAAEEDRARNRLSNVTREIEDIEAQVQSAARSVEELRPDVEAHESSIAEIGKRREELASSRDEMADDLKPKREQLDDASAQLNEAKLNCATLHERATYADRIVTARQRDIASIEQSEAEARRSVLTKRVAMNRAAAVLDLMESVSGSLHRRMRVVDDAVRASETSSHSIHADAASARDAARAARDAFDETSARMTGIQVEKSRLEVQVEAAVERVVGACATPLDVAEQLPQLENRQEVEDEIFKLERRIRNMGTINPDAAQEYAALKKRYDFLAGQLDDMDAARKSLNRIVRVIDARMKDDFVQTFEQVNENFNEVFGILFPGGQAHLSLEDPDDVEHSGVEVTAQPRGKRLTKMMLMSGGEKSLTALALLFAVYKTRTTPFYILDEVEAALDDTNLRRLVSYIDSLRDSTQFIMITHQRRTMEMADVLFGVSMHADGVTKVISQKLERALEHAE